MLLDIDLSVQVGFDFEVDEIDWIAVLLKNGFMVVILLNTLLSICTLCSSSFQS